MKKLKLDLNGLDVASFAVAPRPGKQNGTILGHNEPSQYCPTPSDIFGSCFWTCAVTCHATRVDCTLPP